MIDHNHLLYLYSSDTSDDTIISVQELCYVESFYENEFDNVYEFS